jgi:hypothetical protein
LCFSDFQFSVCLDWNSLLHWIPSLLCFHTFSTFMLSLMSIIPHSCPDMPSLGALLHILFLSSTFQILEIYRYIDR